MHEINKKTRESLEKMGRITWVDREHDKIKYEDHYHSNYILMIKCICQCHSKA